MIALFGPLKSGFWGQKKKDLTPWANRPQRNTSTTETRFWMHWAKNHACQGKLWTHWMNQKKIKKHARVQRHPYANHTPHLSPPTIFCMCCRTADLITHARFQENRFRGFGVPGGRKWASNIDLAHRPYNSVCTNVLHCDLSPYDKLPPEVGVVRVTWPKFKIWDPLHNFRIVKAAHSKFCELIHCCVKPFVEIW